MKTTSLMTSTLLTYSKDSQQKLQQCWSVHKMCNRHDAKILPSTKMRLWFWWRVGSAIRENKKNEATSE